MTPREKKGANVYVFDVIRLIARNRPLAISSGEEVKV